MGGRAVANDFLRLGGQAVNRRRRTHVRFASDFLRLGGQAGILAARRRDQMFGRPGPGWHLGSTAQGSNFGRPRPGWHLWQANRQGFKFWASRARSRARLGRRAMVSEPPRVQILDVPGIVSGAASGKGRGKEVLTVIQNADLVLIVVDVNHPEHYPAILREVWESRIRLNKTKPQVWIKKKSQGGIQIGKTVELNVDDETIKKVMREFKLVNADVLIRSPIDIDDFIDCIEGNKKYVSALTCVSKVDLANASQVSKVKKELNVDIVVSAEDGLNINRLREMIFQKLDFIRVYMKEPRKEADMKEPMIIFRGATIRDVCLKTHKDFVKKFKFARVWGKSAKHPAQKVSLRHKLLDEDVLELHLD